MSFLDTKKAKWLDWATVQQQLLNSFEYFTGAGCYLVPVDQFQPWICPNTWTAPNALGRFCSPLPARKPERWKVP